MKFGEGVLEEASCNNCQMTLLLKVIAIIGNTSHETNLLFNNQESSLFLCHIIRKGYYVFLSLQGLIEHKMVRGRQRQIYLDCLNINCFCSVIATCLLMAHDGVGWRYMVVKVRIGQATLFTFE